MPEIWIPYGNIEVSIDIEPDNLSGLYKNETNIFNSDKIKENTLLNELTDTVNIFDNCNSIGSISIIYKIIKTIEINKSVKEINLIISKNYKKNIQELIKDIKIKITLKIFEELSINELREIIKLKNVIFVSNSTFDPLFGFTGGPISLAKILNDEIINFAFYDKEIILPESGIISHRTQIIKKEYKKYENLISVQIIEDAVGVANCEIGKLNQTFDKSTKLLINNIKPIQKKLEASIISCDYNRINTMINSLHGLWNIHDSLEEKGNVTLVTECLDGFGSVALNQYVQNQVNLKDLINKNEYINGLEDLIFLENIHEKLSINIVSTLPNYYIEKKFKFRPFNTINSALNSTLRRKGKSVTIGIIPYGNNIILESKNNQVKM